MLPKRLLAALAGAVLALGHAGLAVAEDSWPSKPIRIIVPFPAGGSSDPPIRVLAQKLGEALGKAIVVENVSGGGGTIGTARVAQAAPDGYTLGMGAIGTFCLAPFLYSSTGYDPLKSFTQITMLGEYTNVLVVNADSKYKTLDDLLRDGREHPGAVTFGSSGNGSSNHLSVELMSSMTGIRFNHVPFRGTGPALNELLAGRLGFMFDVTNNSLPWIQAGKLRALAVTNTRPVPQLPDVPAVSKAIPGYSVLGWISLMGPAGLPPKVVERLSTEMDKILHSPEFIKQYSALGFEPRFTTPAEMTAVVHKDYDFWGPVVKASGAKAD